MTDSKPRTDAHSLKELSVDDAIQGIKPYEKERNLRTLYHGQNWILGEIAVFYEVDQSTISRAMDDAGVSTGSIERCDGQQTEQVGAD